ncbi:MAG: DUF502 domain-containing protein [Gammaproteobacteria bacterium]|jgi:uncharacterized membrane protein|nr:DUF502 domain-containing protein [Gammaproteobacteria bacterium]MDH3888899.1 DUF502 domain-containing protein [Gammaproteobacteria bacterium]MDH3933665.1 DUF502 domain-containing protein [Gammaproteobacteria bacterium]MDH3970604.1 DUF502 domain-containing protein [Gammaproteobacteria bacterium]MDH3985213.1 DUF502 domain-containing protein [Gammaproteobacteria bacterium]
MDKLKHFLKTSLLGGLVVILPVAILVSVSVWIFDLIASWIQPLTRIVIKDTQTNEFIAETFVIILIVAACFFVGVLVRTRLGGFFYNQVETRILRLAPGYSMIKETVLQLFGSRKDSPFSSVALAQIFCNSTMATCFITDTHDDGSYTVFVPTGPNPTSGLIYHLRGKYVHPVSIPVQDAMRSIISCGAGSRKLMEQYCPELVRNLPDD